jgi:hypothetical protein
VVISKSFPPGSTSAVLTLTPSSFISLPTNHTCGALLFSKNPTGKYTFQELFSKRIFFDLSESNSFFFSNFANSARAKSIFSLKSDANSYVGVAPLLLFDMI